ncbi:MAG: methyltransferase family protein [Candidatus Eiseniibacteriota bacterium]
MPTTMNVPQRLGRWLAFAALLALVALGIAGRADLPMLNAFVGVCLALMLVAMLVIDPDLARERLRRGQAGEDPARLLAIRLVCLALFVFALLDVGRLHWSDRVPAPLQAASLAVFAIAFAWELWAVSANRFFVPVIRVQRERGHTVVSSGPYAIVRHPGYAGMVLLGPVGALALGSWWGLVPGLALSGLFLARAAHEDRFLMASLEGYADYAARVRFRILPGVW